ncbi:MAG TPA: NADH-quinone oxidoreductase subunit C [bacterium]|jgi:NADH-quinone oxidoreductase subunit C|nr:NADH-quinone oxidoreductase subunit C [bacterium]
MTNEELKSKIEVDFKDEILSAVISAQKEAIVTVAPDRYVALCQKLHDKGEYFFNHLSSLTAVDYPKENKITVVSHLWSYKHFHQVTIKVDADRNNPKVPTLENVWKSANWFEREVFDLYGVVFEGHSDLRRIMMPDDYKKFPLRKDFADDGFIVKPS